MGSKETSMQLRVVSDFAHVCQLHGFREWGIHFKWALLDLKKKSFRQGRSLYGEITMDIDFLFPVKKEKKMR